MVVARAEQAPHERIHAENGVVASGCELHFRQFHFTENTNGNPAATSNGEHARQQMIAPLEAFEVRVWKPGVLPFAIGIGKLNELRGITDWQSSQHDRIQHAEDCSIRPYPQCQRYERYRGETGTAAQSA